MPSGSILGNRVVRLEDPTLLTGAGKYVDDLVASGTSHIAFVRSSVAHGTIRSVDVEEASSMPGVVAVYHAGGDDLGLAPFQGFPMLPDTFNRPVFARDTVRFVGDVIAAVVAESAAQAEDAAAAVIVDIDTLPAIVKASDGLAPDSPPAFPRRWQQRMLRDESRHRRGPAGRRRRGSRGADGQPAPRRRAYGTERLPGNPRRA